MNVPNPVASALTTVGRLSFLTSQGLVAVLSPPWELRTWINEMEQIGVRSLGVAAVTTVFTGMVLALQTAYSLPALGVKYYIGTVVAKSVVRELGPVLTALIVGGRIGAGITAELGTMRVTDQVDALRSMAADPIKKLVAPKIVATLVMLPALTAVGLFLGILGGLLVAVFQLQLTPGFYINDVLNSLTLEDFFSGLGKSFFFSYFITVIACHNGLHARGGADGVGRATTNTVVMSAIMVLISDFFLTKLFYLIG
ncbi:MAG: ABC transporter permease [Acidobacteriota bacterium]|nr:ABC transporter permease [Acidobacteriota bacterium]